MNEVIMIMVNKTVITIRPVRSLTSGSFLLASRRMAAAAVAASTVQMPRRSKVKHRNMSMFNKIDGAGCRYGLGYIQMMKKQSNRQVLGPV